MVNNTEFLSSDAIKVAMTPEALAYLPCLEIKQTITSTNSYVLEKAKQGQTSGYTVLAEEQTAGRGRRGKKWVSPFGSNIYLSLLWVFDKSPKALNGLTIVAGIAVVKALERYGISSLKLKWPNDVLWHGHKLSGILVETLIDTQGVCYAVIGIGINADLPKSAANSISQPWIDIKTIIGCQPNRNQLAGFLIEEMLSALLLFQHQGLNLFLSNWRALDALYGQEIMVSSTNSSISGRMCGIDNKGGLRLQVDKQELVFYTGEVSVRLMVKA